MPLSSQTVDCLTINLRCISTAAVTVVGLAFKLTHLCTCRFRLPVVLIILITVFVFLLYSDAIAYCSQPQQSTFRNACVVTCHLRFSLRTSGETG